VNFLRDAVRALHENIRSVLLYMGLVAVLNGAQTLVEKLVFAPIADSTPDSRMGLYLMGSRVLLVAGAAFADTVFLSRIGREVDKPYWRIPDDREAIRRFYRFWLLLGLANLTYGLVTERISGGDAEHPGVFFLFLSYIVWIVLLHAFGTTVMFFGKVARDEINEAFGVLSRHAPLVIGLCLFGVFAAILLQGAYGAIRMGGLSTPAEVLATTLLAAADGYVSCLIFAYMWLVCRYDRDDFQRENEDFDL